MATPASSALSEVDGCFTRHVTGGAAPSAVWGIFDRNGLVHSGSAGTLTDGQAPGADTAYRIASCTKSFTAAALLSLRDEGRVNLDAPITAFVPSFSAVTLPSVDSPTPTIRMLLTMSAGLPTDDPWADRMEAMTVTELDGLLESGLSFDSIPGTQFAYSNLGYALLGRVIESASRQPYRELVSERFLQPLGLTRTGFDSDLPAADRVAIGTRRTPAIPGASGQTATSGAPWQPLPNSSPGVFSPIGGLFSTVRDLSTWARWLSAAFDETSSLGSTPSEPLSRASRRELQQLQRFSPRRGAHPTGYGFGLFVEHYPDHGPVISHSGGYPGFSAHMRWSPRTGLGIVAFENATSSRVSVPTSEAFDALLAASGGQSKPVIWSATRSAQQQITRLIHTWSDVTAHQLFAVNVPFDDSWEHRRSAIAAAIEEIGGLEADSPQNDRVPSRPDDERTGPDEESAAPSHLAWRIPGRAEHLRVEIQLNPENPPRVQTLKVTTEKAEKAEKAEPE